VVKRQQLILIFGGILLFILIYFFGQTLPPGKKNALANKENSAPADQKPLEFQDILKVYTAKLSPAQLSYVNRLENSVVRGDIKNQQFTADMQLAAFWRDSVENAFLPAAYYTGEAAKLENSEKKLTFAGQFFLQLMENEGSPSVQAWEEGEAVSCLEQSLKIDPDNEDTKLALATGYIEGTGEPMRGVQILLAITREKPDDIPANMLLGRMSIQSGQFDKALGRFETVLKQEPENKEALYFLAQAYEGKGDKKKAIELLEKCKQIVNDPGFSKEIDQHINSLK